MLFNEPKLLKCAAIWRTKTRRFCFSALQRAEIAEILPDFDINNGETGFSALQRAEIAEIADLRHNSRTRVAVSVLFNEPKLLKSNPTVASSISVGVSVLFNEPKLLKF